MIALLSASAHMTTISLHCCLLLNERQLLQNPICMTWYSMTSFYLLQDENDADGKRGVRAGGERRGGGDDTDNAKKLVQDLADAFNDFGVSHSAVLWRNGLSWHTLLYSTHAGLHAAAAAYTGSTVLVHTGLACASYFLCVSCPLSDCGLSKVFVSTGMFPMTMHRQHSCPLCVCIFLCYYHTVPHHTIPYLPYRIVTIVILVHTLAGGPD